VAITPSAIEEALSLHPASDARSIHVLEVGLARLLLAHAPAAAQQQLELAAEFLRGAAAARDLKSAQQDCWSYVGSLACGCSVADSASGAAFLACLDPEPSAHTRAALAEQVARAIRAGASEDAILAVLGAVEAEYAAPSVIEAALVAQHAERDVQER
jgi:hypothetical protein